MAELCKSCGKEPCWCATPCTNCGEPMKEHLFSARRGLAACEQNKRTADLTAEQKLRHAAELLDRTADMHCDTDEAPFVRHVAASLRQLIVIEPGTFERERAAAVEQRNAEIERKLGEYGASMSLGVFEALMFFVRGEHRK